MDTYRILPSYNFGDQNLTLKKDKNKNKGNGENLLLSGEWMYVLYFYIYLLYIITGISSAKYSWQVLCNCNEQSKAFSVA